MKCSASGTSCRAKINLVVTGGVNALMNKIFKSMKEPLYGCDTDRASASLSHLGIKERRFRECLAKRKVSAFAPIEMTKASRLVTRVSWDDKKES